MFIIAQDGKAYRLSNLARFDIYDPCEREPYYLLAAEKGGKVDSYFCSIEIGRYRTREEAEAALSEILENVKTIDLRVTPSQEEN